MSERVMRGATASPIELSMLIAALDRLNETIMLIRSELEPGDGVTSGRHGPSQRRDGLCTTVTLRPSGEYWTIGRERTFLLRYSLGLRYLARLVAEPGREFHVLDLAAPAGSAQPVAERSLVDRWEPVGEDVLVDATARAAYRTRLAELDAEREELLSGDGSLQGAASAGLETIDGEIDALRAELARAYGLGGRPRQWVSEAERARQRVSKAIRSAIERIGVNDDQVGSHLRHSIRTGVYCSYDPDPGSAVRWRL